MSDSEKCELIQRVMSHTTYTKEQASEKLQEFNNDYIKVIKDYMGISEKKEQKKKSVNQEIFRQIRHSLDASMKQYRDEHPVDFEQVVDHFEESDRRKYSTK
jgi:hypothetical protein